MRTSAPNRWRPTPHLLACDTVCRWWSVFWRAAGSMSVKFRTGATRLGRRRWRRWRLGTRGFDTQVGGEVLLIVLGGCDRSSGAADCMDCVHYTHTHTHTDGQRRPPLSSWGKAPGSARPPPPRSTRIRMAPSWCDGRTNRCCASSPSSVFWPPRSSLVTKKQQQTKKKS